FCRERPTRKDLVRNHRKKAAEKKAADQWDSRKAAAGGWQGTARNRDRHWQQHKCFAGAFGKNDELDRTTFMEFDSEIALILLFPPRRCYRGFPHMRHGVPRREFPHAASERRR